MSINKFQPKGFLVWILCSTFFLYEFFLRTVIGTYQHPVMQDLDLTSFQFSLLSTTLLIAASTCALASLGFAYAYSYPIAILFRLLMGFGASFGFICMLMSVYEWMPHRYSAIFIGISQFIGTMGPILAAGPLETIAESSNISWRSIFITLGIIGICLTSLIFFFVDNNRDTRGAYTILYKPEKLSSSLRRLFSRSQAWVIAVLTACLFVTIEYLSENEGRSFLGLRGFTSSEAGFMITLGWIGYGIGCPLMGILSDTLQRRKIVLSISAVLALVSIIMVLYATDKLGLHIGFLLLGLSASGQVVGFAIMAEQFKKQFIAIGFGLNNAMLNTLSAVNAPVIGSILDMQQEQATPSLNDYLMVFNILIAIAVLTVILSVFFIKETFCKSAVDFTIIKK